MSHCVYMYKHFRVLHLQGGSSHAESLSSTVERSLTWKIAPNHHYSNHAMPGRTHLILSSRKGGVSFHQSILSTNIRSHIAALTEGSHTLFLPCRPCSICTTPFSNLARRFVNLVYLMPYASLQQCLQTLFPATVNRTDATDPEQSLCRLR